MLSFKNFLFANATIYKLQFVIIDRRVVQRLRFDPHFLRSGFLRIKSSLH